MCFRRPWKKASLSYLIQCTVSVTTLLQSVITSLTKPLFGDLIVLTNTLPIVVHHTQIILGFRNPLFCSLTIPLLCLYKVLKDSFPIGIHPTQIILGFGMPLSRRLAIPLHCLCIVLTDPLPIVVHHTQIILGSCKSLFCSLKRFLKIRHIISPSCLPYAQSQQSNHHFFQPCVHFKLP